MWENLLRKMVNSHVRLTAVYRLGDQKIDWPILMKIFSGLLFNIIILSILILNFDTDRLESHEVNIAKPPMSYISLADGLILSSDVCLMCMLTVGYWWDDRDIDFDSLYRTPLFLQFSKRKCFPLAWFFFFFFFFFFDGFGFLPVFTWWVQCWQSLCLLMKRCWSLVFDSIGYLHLTVFCTVSQNYQHCLQLY